MSRIPGQTEVLIIGGGIIGCSLAESLSRAGLTVTLLERGLIGREASWAAAGMLAPQSEMPCAGPYLDFCLASRRLYPAVIERIRTETGIDPQYRDEGMFYIARTESEEKILRERAAWQKPSGLAVEILSAEEARKAEPSLASGFRMAVHFKEDHQLDPRLMTRGYAIAARRLGARLLEYSPVTEILRERNRAVGVVAGGKQFFGKWIILAGGCWSGLIPDLPFRPPTYPVKGQVLLLQATPSLFKHTLHSVEVYLAPRRDGRIIVGATEEHEAGFDKTVQAGAVAKLLSSAFELVPSLTRAEWADCWAGLRPGTPDRRPIIGEEGLEGLILATGHFRNGVLLAPLTALRASEFILEGKWNDDVAQFSPRRFAGENCVATT